ncbi:hypothetical protein ACFRMO_25325 [Streptomyces anulatus]|uniref:hypothetical protein n=1 Tax=Streptomyces TaxID=1883 RepID=UPI001B38F6B6|nr:hypothetical protein [Streptomyces sp. C3-3]MBQ1117004.1 hypothetical protein [Streptomyces sp. C3-3]
MLEPDARPFDTVPAAGFAVSAPARPDVDFTVVRNGMDYLRSAVRHLAGSEGAEPDDHALKYAVLHLQAATEVLLKARLTHEHWSLVFTDPGAASWQKFTTGDFESCSLATTLDRLEKIAQVRLTPRERTAISSLAKTRNALTHYGHSASAYQVEAQAARVLGLLLTFVSEHLRPPQATETAFVELVMEEVRGRLGAINALVEERMKQISSRLTEYADYTVICPDCRQCALVVGESPEWPTCLFCLQKFAASQEAALRWGWEVLGDPEHVDWYVDDCGCTEGAGSLLWPVNTAASPVEDVALCFSCGAVYAEVKDR